MEGFSTAQAAKLVGVSKKTLLRWLYDGRLKEPRHANVAGRDWRLWGKADVERARKLKTTIRPGPKPRKRK